MARPGQFVKVGGYTLPAKFDEAKLENRALYDWKFRRNDVLIAGFPKSGNNWLVKVVQSMYSDWGLCNFGGRGEAAILEEHTVLKIPMSEARGQALESINIDELPSPRLMRTHLPAPMIPLQRMKESGAKVISISRNPKDVCVSYFHFLKSFQHGAWSVGNWEQFVQAFIQDVVLFSPWSKYVIEWFEHGLDDNVLHVSYEEMKEDISGIIKKIANFLDRPLCDDDIKKVVTATSVGAMKKMHSTEIMHADDAIIPEGQNPFVRKGIVGDWKNHFTVAQSDHFDSEIGKKVRDANPNIPYQ